MIFRKDKQDESSSATSVEPEPQAPESPGVPDTTDESEPGTQPGAGRARNMLPGRERRRFGIERVLTRLVATCGVIGIGVVIAAIMVSNHSQGWLVGLVVACVSVILSAILWSSRQL